MASVDVEIGARKYSVACRDGEEEHLKSVAALVDKKARDAEAALGNMGEARQLLFASLLLADELKDARAGTAAAAPEPQPAQEDPAVAEALERIAEQMETLAQRLEQGAATPYIGS
ncbi:MAG TPA: cell division protein ZapA [Allosphingosinicella sp.]|jgi:cell division protein ZapA